jgi:hypothetical protein
MPSSHAVLQALMSSPHEANVKAGLDVLEFVCAHQGQLHPHKPDSSTALGASTQKMSDTMFCWPHSAGVSHADDAGWDSLMAAVVQLAGSSSMLGEVPAT